MKILCSDPKWRGILGSRGPTCDSARYKKYTARMIPIDATPSRRDQESAHAVALEISHRHRIKTKSVARDPASVCPEQMSIFARVKVSTPSSDSRSGVLPCTYDEIRMAVSIDIARYGWASSESFAC